MLNLGAHEVRPGIENQRLCPARVVRLDTGNHDLPQLTIAGSYPGIGSGGLIDPVLRPPAVGRVSGAFGEISIEQRVSCGRELHGRYRFEQSKNQCDSGNPQCQLHVQAGFMSRVGLPSRCIGPGHSATSGSDRRAAL